MGRSRVVTRSVTTMRPPATRSATSLVEQARAMLRDAERETDAAERARPAGRRRLVSAWALVDAVAPELSDWSAYFARTADTRAAIEAGARSVVSDRDADDQRHAAEQFLALVEQSLGLLAAPLAS
jgi:SAV_6107-like HEPN